MFSKRIALVGVAAVLSLSALAPTVSASPRSGDLHVTKDCTDYHGAAGESCTITVSNIKAIPAGARVVYAVAAGATTLDSDVTWPAARVAAAFFAAICSEAYVGPLQNKAR